MKQLGAFAGLIAPLLVAQAVAAQEPSSDETATLYDAEAEEADGTVEPEASGEQDGAANTEPDYPIGLWGMPVRRHGFHFQVGFGVGGGPDTLGLFHTMEIGYSWEKSTVAMLHTFIQNKGVFGTELGGPDLIGGWMIEYKRTLFYPDLVWKVAAGLGGTHDQTDGIKATGGFGMSYGLDLHLPVARSSGPTVTLAAMNLFTAGNHHFGLGLGLGYTWF